MANQQVSLAKRNQIILIVAIIAASLGVAAFIIVHPLSQGCDLERRLDFKSASNLYQNALTNPIYSIEPLIYLRLAYCNRQMENFSAAYKNVDKGFAVTKAHPIYSAISSIWNGPIDYKLFVEQGYIFYKDNKYKDAINCFNNALSINGGGKAYLGLAAVYESSGDFQKVNEYYSKALNVTSGSDKESVFHERAIYHRNQGRDKEAIEDLTKAVDLFDCAQAYYDRAKLYKKDGNLDNALMDFNRAIRYQSTEKYYHARAMLKSEMKDLKGALKDINSAYKMDPSCKTLEQDKALVEEQMQTTD